jgi:hypothetical protein
LNSERKTVRDEYDRVYCSEISPSGLVSVCFRLADLTKRKADKLDLVDPNAVSTQPPASHAVEPAGKAGSHPAA